MHVWKLIAHELEILHKLFHNCSWFSYTWYKEGSQHLFCL